MDGPDRAPRPSSGRRLTAYHEAGHAVMAHLGGQRITGLELLDSGELAGACTTLRRIPVHLSTESLESLEHHVRCLLAGVVAEARVSGREGWDEACADLDLAVRLAMRLVGDCERVLPYLEAVRERVEAELATSWTAVEALAEVLLAAGSLDGAAATAVLERMLPGGGRPSRSLPWVEAATGTA